VGLASTATTRQPRPASASGASFSVTAIAAAAKAVTAHLTRLGVDYALVGGFAISVRTEPRFTQDLDLVVAVDDDSAAERVVWSLSQQGYETTSIVEQELKERLATVRLKAPDRSGLIDLLFASSGIEPEIAAAAEPMPVLPGLGLPVARVGHLLALKILARDDETRPQDFADIRALLSVADEAELARAAEAVELIHERGYDRGRDLRAALAGLLG
jgi:hypothetical protein